MLAITQASRIRGREDQAAVDLVDKEWEAATEGKRTSRRSLLAQDRNDPNHYVAIVFFDSYESAQKNSDLPETTAAAEKMTKLMDAPPSFLDLEVIDDRA